MRIGMLTGGGDCPGLNAVIRAVVRKGVLHYGDEFIGFLEGWRGVLDDRTMPLDLQTTTGILQRGGTILRSSRTNVKKIEGGFERCLEVIAAHKLDALIAMGGDDTQSISVELAKRGVNCVGVPKTIDNDLSGTDICFGFDTAVTIATEAIDRLHSTTEAHSRVQVVEVMGRDAGWIAVTSGIAGGADVILAPEHPIDLDDVVRLLRARWESGKRFAIVVVAEGAKLPEHEGQTTVGTKLDSFGHARLSGIGQVLAEEIEKRTGYETRAVNLGHTQRGGTPTAYDRMLATRYGVAAIDLVHAGKFGRLVVLKGTQIADIPIADAIAKTRTVTDDLFAVVKASNPNPEPHTATHAHKISSLPSHPNSVISTAASRSCLCDAKWRDPRIGLCACTCTCLCTCHCRCSCRCRCSFSQHSSHPNTRHPERSEGPLYWPLHLPLHLRLPLHSPSPHRKVPTKSSHPLLTKTLLSRCTQ